MAERRTHDGRGRLGETEKDMYKGEWESEEVDGKSINPFHCCSAKQL